MSHHDFEARVADLFRIRPMSPPPTPTVADLLEYIERVRATGAEGGMATLASLPASLRPSVLAGLAQQTRPASRRAVVVGGNMIRMAAHADRGAMASAIWAQGPSHPAWQAALTLGWLGGSTTIVSAAGSRARLIQWFDAAAPWEPVPFLRPHLLARHEMPEQVEVFRGGLLDTGEPLNGGYSWSGRPEVAALYAALRSLEFGAPPVIVRAQVRREAIRLRTRTRDDECVLVEQVEGAEVHLVDREKIERLAATEAAGRSYVAPSETLHLDPFDERCWAGWRGDE